MYTLIPEGLPHHFWLTLFFRLSLSGATHHIWQMAYDPFAHTRTLTYSTPYSAVDCKLKVPSCVCVCVYAVHHVQKALEICTAVPCIKHEDSRRKEVASRVNLHLVVSLSPPFFTSPSLHHTRLLPCICFKKQLSLRVTCGLVIMMGGHSVRAGRTIRGRRGTGTN